MRPAKAALLLVPASPLGLCGPAALAFDLKTHVSRVTPAVSTVAREGGQTGVTRLCRFADGPLTARLSDHSNPVVKSHSVDVEASNG